MLSAPHRACQGNVAVGFSLVSRVLCHSAPQGCPRRYRVSHQHRNGKQEQPGPHLEEQHDSEFWRGDHRSAAEFRTHLVKPAMISPRRETGVTLKTAPLVRARFSPKMHASHSDKGSPLSQNMWATEPRTTGSSSHALCPGSRKPLVSGRDRSRPVGVRRFSPVGLGTASPRASHRPSGW